MLGGEGVDVAETDEVGLLSEITALAVQVTQVVATAGNIVESVADRVLGSEPQSDSVPEAEPSNDSPEIVRLRQRMIDALNASERARRQAHRLQKL